MKSLSSIIREAKCRDSRKEFKCFKTDMPNYIGKVLPNFKQAYESLEESQRILNIHGTVSKYLSYRESWTRLETSDISPAPLAHFWIWTSKVCVFASPLHPFTHGSYCKTASTSEFWTKTGLNRLCFIWLCLYYFRLCPLLLVGKRWTEAMVASLSTFEPKMVAIIWTSNIFVFSIS